MVSRTTRLGLEFVQKTLEEKVETLRSELNKLAGTVSAQKSTPGVYGVNLIKSVKSYKGNIVWSIPNDNVNMYSIYTGFSNYQINDMNINCYKTNKVSLVYTLVSDLFVAQNTYVIYYVVYENNAKWKKIPIRCRLRGVLIINKDPGIAFDTITIFKLPNTPEAIDAWTSDNSSVESRREFLHMCGEPLKLTEKNFAAY